MATRGVCEDKVPDQDVRGHSKTTSFSPAAAWKRGSVEALERLNTPPLERSDRSPAWKERAAAGEIYGVMNDCVSPTDSRF